MRHGDKIKNLGRTASHRRALMANLAINLIEHKRIITTLTKAKSLRVYVEPLITRSKQDTTHNRRIVFSYLQNKESVKELFGTISDKVADRPGGYTRIIKMAPRFGDAAEMALIELVDFNEIYKKETADTDKKKTRRSRRGGSGAAKATTATEPTATATEETTAAPAPEEAVQVEESAAGETAAETMTDTAANAEAPAPEPTENNNEENNA